MTRVLHLDFETASTADLKRTGASRYSRDPSTRVICMGWQFSDAAPKITRVWTWGNPFPQEVIDHVLAGGEVHGWNVMFEYLIWNNVLVPRLQLPPLDLEQVHCSMARALYWGLPGKLDLAGQALGTTFQKDKAGHALMLRMSKPRRIDPVTGAPVWWDQSDPGKLAQLRDYCARDVDTEIDIAERLPKLPSHERKVWLLDARMNLRGLEIDTVLVSSLKVVTSDAIRALDARMRELTGGEVPSTSAVAKLLWWVRLRGVKTDSLTKEKIKHLLAEPWLPQDVRAVLKLRKAAAKTSTAKLDAMLDAADTDDRVRGLWQYGGAGRTMRWAGRLVQAQNLPRPMKGLDTDQVIELALRGADADTIGLVHGEPLDVVASCLRPCFQAGYGHVLVDCDFSAIEARVVAWLAGQQDILDVFARGDDVYVYTANGIGSTDRQLGKVLVLACGFGMGPGKFLETAASYGIVLTPEQAEKLVAAWRLANRKIVSFWWDLERAVREVIEGIVPATQLGFLTIRMGRPDRKMCGQLLIQKPSGATISYRNPRLEMVDGRSQITYDGLNQYTRKWEPIRTYGGKLAENVTQSVARDLLADAMLRMEDIGLPLVGTVHDEVIAEVGNDHGEGALAAMKHIMSTGPAWANGLPLGGAGWVGKRYGKA